MTRPGVRLADDVLGFGLVLFAMFLVCKLTGFVDWSWWFVFAPLWIPIALVAAICLVLRLTVWVLAGVINGGEL